MIQAWSFNLGAAVGGIFVGLVSFFSSQYLTSHHKPAATATPAAAAAPAYFCKMDNFGTRLEVSGDGGEWTTVAQGPLLVRLVEGSSPGEPVPSLCILDPLPAGGPLKMKPELDNLPGPAPAAGEVYLNTFGTTAGPWRFAGPVGTRIEISPDGRTWATAAENTEPGKALWLRVTSPDWVKK
jgi:hypothetical protein